MYLHLGQDTVIQTKDIIGIFDLENSTISKYTREYLAKAEKEGKVVNVSMESEAGLWKTFRMCSKMPDGGRKQERNGEGL